MSLVSPTCLLLGAAFLQYKYWKKGAFLLWLALGVRLPTPVCPPLNKVYGDYSTKAKFQLDILITVSCEGTRL